jgi:hypothetical protein
MAGLLYLPNGFSATSPVRRRRLQTKAGSFRPQVCTRIATAPSTVLLAEDKFLSEKTSVLLLMKEPPPTPRPEECGLELRLGGAPGLAQVDVAEKGDEFHGRQVMF